MFPLACKHAPKLLITARWMCYYKVDSGSRRTKLTELEAIQNAASTISNADMLLFCTGAGMGVDSGLPDFRGPEGFWKAYPPMKKLNLELPDMSTPSWFQSDPSFAWGFWSHRTHLYKNTIPHLGYSILKEWADDKQSKSKDKGINNAYFSFTSNVDGHWQRIVPPENLLEVHGTLTHWQCIKDCKSDIWLASQDDIPFNEETFRAHSPLPSCKYCNEIARPNVLMFGDWGWNPARTHNQEGNFESFMAQITKETKLAVIEIGAGLGVPTVRRTAERMAQQNGGTLIRINVRDPEIGITHSGSSWIRSNIYSPKGLSIPLPGLEALKKIKTYMT